MPPTLRPPLRSFIPTPRIPSVHRRTAWTSKVSDQHLKTLSSAGKAFWYARFFAFTSGFILLSVGAGGLLIQKTIPFSGPIDRRPISTSRDCPTSEASDLANKLTLVRVLRESGEYDEFDAWGENVENRARKFTASTLAGPQKIALNRVFLHKNGQESISILSLGPALSGYPNVVHGGVLATILDESLGRLALGCFPNRNGVTAKLELNYRKPTRARPEGSPAFTVLRSRVVGATEKKAQVVGQVEDLDGNILVEADGLFVVPRSWSLVSMKRF